jgi:Domain of Unknown Function (DUF1080)
MSSILAVITSSFLIFFILSSITIIVSNASLYDDFKSGVYTLSNGQISPNGKWQSVYNGDGSSGVKMDIDNGSKKHVFFMYPKASTNYNETNANLVKSTQQFSNFKMDVDVKTVEQTRRNSTPNNWEAAWILFRYTDDLHYYWFVLKSNGVELGKKDCNTCKDSFQGQIYLNTTENPTLKIGDWSRWEITTVGNQISLAINGTRVVDFVDNKMSNKLARGSIGLYTEDAKVEFGDINITPL